MRDHNVTVIVVETLTVKPPEASAIERQLCTHQNWDHVRQWCTFSLGGTIK